MPLRASILLISAVLLVTACNPGDTDASDSAPDTTPAAETIDQSPRSDLTPADGYTALHDVSLPEPGTALLTIAGEEFPLDITCSGHEGAGGTSIMIFSFEVNGSGVSPDGRETMFMASRHVLEEVDSFYGIQDKAMVQLGVSVEGGLTHSAIVSSPADGDMQGALLPLLHVSPEGGFTMQAPIERLHNTIHAEAPAGDAVLAGQCQEGWQAEQV